ncbi:14321_t:CDS:1, partial [Funneliformis mosseae]
LEETVVLDEKKLKKLKGNAEAQKRAQEKKKEKLNKENIIEMYDAP